MKTASITCALLTILLLSQAAFGHRFKEDASVRIVTPVDGARVTSPVHVTFDAKRIKVAPVGVNKHRAGHFILLIDHSHPNSWENVIAMDAHHLHFVEGETEAYIELDPGTHTLQLVLGDEEHMPWDEQLVSKRITIHVVGVTQDTRD